MQAAPADSSLLLELWRNTAPLAFIACCGFLARVNGRLVKIETLLKVIGGETGSNGELGKMRSATHDLRDAVQGMETKVAVHEQRLSSGGI